MFIEDDNERMLVIGKMLMKLMGISEKYSDGNCNPRCLAVAMDIDLMYRKRLEELLKLESICREVIADVSGHCCYDTIEADRIEHWIEEQGYDFRDPNSTGKNV